MKGDDQILTYDDYSNKTVVKQIGNSVVASGGYNSVRNWLPYHSLQRSTS